MLKLGIMVSGGGTNLQAIIDKIDSGYLEGCSIATVVSSRQGAYAWSGPGNTTSPLYAYQRSASLRWKNTTKR